MTRELVEIQPTELKFILELKKQSSCSIQLFNTSDLYVAYKVKTTSPKKYCVRPNMGVVSPHSPCEITVTMQAQQTAPLDMQCKDKFLVQSIIVPEGTTMDQVSSDMFVKEDGRIIDQKKLKVALVDPHSPVLQPKVALVSPPQSPVLQPINGVTKQNPIFENIKTMEQDHFSSEDSREDSPPPSQTVSSLSSHVLELKAKETKAAVRELTGKLNEADVEELKSKLNEAEKIITSLREERSAILQQREVLQLELMVAKRRRPQVRVGYPFLFVCFIGFVGLMFGYMLSS